MVPGTPGCTHDEARARGSAYCQRCGAQVFAIGPGQPAGYPPPGAVPPYQGYPPQPGYPSYQGYSPYPPPDDGRDIAMWTHLGPLIALAVGLSLLGWVVPLVLRSDSGRQRPFVRAHATESLNFQLSMLVYGVGLLVIGIPLAIVTFGLALLALVPIYLALFVFEVVVMIKASIAANRGQLYAYPLNIRFAR